MAIWYSDVAAAQLQGVNFPGTTGLSSGISTLPSTQTQPLLEAPGQLVATYIWSGTEAAGDVINWGIIPAGQMVDPWGHWQNGATAPATTLTAAIGDNDLGLIAVGSTTGGLPITNPTAALTNTTGIQAPTWISGTAYAVGAVVLDPTATPANQTYTCIAATSSATAPHSLSSNWVANSTRYSTSINVAGASAAVAFTPPAIYSGFNPYITANDSWLQSTLLTVTTPVAGAVSVLRVNLNCNN